MNAKKIAIALFGFAALLSPAQALAAPPPPPPGPAWHLTVAQGPTKFAPGTEEEGGGGPQYLLIATNIGGGPTSGGVTLEATLPVGVKAMGFSGDHEGADFSDPVCSEPTPQTISCETSDPVYPGRWIGAAITLEIESIPPATLSTEASISGGGATTVTETVPTEISPQLADFDFMPARAGLDVMLTNADGSPATQAGSHPYQLTTTLGFTVQKVEGVMIPAGYVHDLRVDLPRGLIANPNAATALCTEAQLNASETEERCPDEAQVGTVSLMTVTGGLNYGAAPLYRMVPPAGVPAMFAFNAAGIGIFVHLAGDVRSDGDFGLSAEASDVFAPATSPIVSAQTQLWGDPSSPSHDRMRGDCALLGGVCPIAPQSEALLSMPTHCTGPIQTTVSVDTWNELGVFHRRSTPTTDLLGAPKGIEGCADPDLKFEPSLKATPTSTVADSPSGLSFNLHQPQDFDLDKLSTAALKDAVVTLPEGLTVNPAAANGQQVCSAAQIGLTSAVGQTPVRFNEVPDSCPDAAKIGSLQVSTPLLDDPLPGSVYLAEPFKNPFGTLLGIYLSVNDPPTGTVAKFAAQVKADPVTGQLTNVLTEGPQLPLEDVEIEVFGGDRGSLRTPPACATYTTTANLTPWSAPEGANATSSDSFAINTAPGGKPCPATPQGAPNQPGFVASMLTPQAGAYSPFILNVTREDATQPIGGFEATLPKGLLAKLAGVPYCPEAQIAQAQARSHPNEGAIEQASPSCPAASQIGTVDAAGGAGPSPVHVGGKVYLAGPYKGAPLSSVIVTPAVAGPFDLGTVVVRAALYVDPEAAQGRVVSDPLPTILEGIPLDLRSAYVKLDRPNFTLNPTSCDPKSVLATATSVFGQSVPLTSAFQVGGCKALGFKPSFSFKLKGGTKRTGHPSLRVVANFKAGNANLERAEIALPRSEFLDQAHIGTVCTRVQFAANQCPKRSIYGFAKATTPLLDKPLEGPVYLRSSNNELPDMVIALKGQVDIVLASRIDSLNGGIRATAENVPDGPVTKFVLEMQGGRKGLLINSRDLCAKRSYAQVKLDGQNGKTHDFKALMKNDCGKKKKQKGNKRSAQHR